MKAPWILIWALASVPVFAQGPFPTDDRGQAFDVILDFVEEARAEELQGSRDAVDALREELIALRDLDEPDEDAIASVREDLIASRRDLSDEIRAEIGANEDLHLVGQAAVQLGHLLNLAVRCAPRGVQHTVRKNIVATAMQRYCHVGMTKHLSEDGSGHEYFKINITANEV